MNYEHNSRDKMGHTLKYSTTKLLVVQGEGGRFYGGTTPDGNVIKNLSGYENVIAELGMRNLEADGTKDAKLKALEMFGRQRREHHRTMGEVHRGSMQPRQSTKGEGAEVAPGATDPADRVITVRVATLRTIVQEMQAAENPDHAANVALALINELVYQQKIQG